MEKEMSKVMMEIENNTITLPEMESSYKELLNPIKNEEKAFAVDIPQLLHSFLFDLLSKTSIPNFNSASLVLQGSVRLYEKKVEYLHKLTDKMFNNLHGEISDLGEKQEIKRKVKKNKVIDPFLLPMVFKRGKNLSCLRRKNATRESHNSSKKPINGAIPADLLFNDNEDKGDIFYDTKEEIVGLTGDFALNRCRLLSSGWLLLPTVSSDLVSSLSSVSNYNSDDDVSIYANEIDDMLENNCVNGIQSTPDEGIGSCPSSSVLPSTTPTSVENNNTESPNAPSTSNAVASSIDEGIFGTPDDVADSQYPATSEDDENIPMEDEESDDSDPVPQPIRRSNRRALETCQLEIDDPLAGINITKDLLTRRKIEKGIVFRLPAKLRKKPGDVEVIPSITAFCNKHCYAIDEKELERSLLSFDTESFGQNSRLVKKMMRKLKFLKETVGNELIDPVNGEIERNLEEIERLQEPSEEEKNFFAPVENSDINIQHDISLLPSEPSSPLNINDDDVPEIPEVDLESPNINHVLKKEHERHIAELHKFVQNSEMNQRVQEWEEKVKPFLEELDRRETFDINLYGSRLLNSFKDNNRKQTISFRKFCKEKEKWEIHRYFMALLPLINVGNVSIEVDEKNNTTEDIAITLLSRKMHHTELENFGHSDGSHS